MRPPSLNHIYRLVWSPTLGAYVAVAEIARGQGRGQARVRARRRAKRTGTGGGQGGFGWKPLALLLAASLGGIGSAVAAGPAPNQLPAGGTVVSGSGSIAQAGNTLTVTQKSSRLITDWNSFSIGSQGQVVFNQPNAAAVSLNRVTGTSASLIDGALRANGQVFLINPNGVMFGNGARVDVGALVASTLQMSNADFNAGKYRFTGNGQGGGRIDNAGRIDAPGGVVALIAPQVGNSGRITADAGSVVLAAGQAVELDFVGDGLVKLKVEPAQVDTLLENKGLLQADGGAVVMSTATADALHRAVVNTSGEIRAHSLVSRGGRIYLDSGAGGRTTVAGTVDASSPAAKGGEIVATGQRVEVESGARLTASGAAGGGQVLVGGSWQGQDPAIRQASETHIESGALLEANATVQGDGGTVVAWSDVRNPDSVTRAAGIFQARGGGLGGDGGRVETSGHRLDIHGASVDASAPKGKGGLWLLDPTDVTIDSTYASTIVTSLNAGTNVMVQTASGGGSRGDITVSAAIAKTAGSDATLTLKAANSIIVDQPISSSTGKLHVALDADNDSGTGDGAGIILLNADITTNGGNLGFGTGRTATINGVSTLVGGDVFVAGSGARSLTTGGGSVDVMGEMIVANTDGLTIGTSGGNVRFYGLLNSGNSYQSISYSGTWGSALAIAQSGSGSSTGSTYLATITSRLENAVAGRTVNYQASWLGARRTTGIGTNALWRWVAGPEGLQDGGNGLGFFIQNGSDTVNGSSGTAYNGGYSNWSGGEPNNWGASNLAQAGETALQFTGNLGQWNDLPQTGNSLSYYVKETNLAASPLTINAGAGTVTFSGAVGGSKALASLNVSASGGIAINGGAVATEGAQAYTGSTTAAGTTTITANALTLSSTLSGSGSLVIQPYSSGTTIGLAGGSGTLSLPADYFSSNFSDGFSDITIGSATAGSINVGSLSYRDPLMLKTGGDISLAASAAVTSSGSNSLTLWTTGGTINTGASSTIATNGGNLTYLSSYAGTDKPLVLAGGAAAGAGAINITANALALTGSLSGSGSLLVEPYSSNTTIGIAGGSGALSLPASYFSTNFSGFSGIAIGNVTAGSITVGNDFASSYTSPLVSLQTGGDISITANELAWMGTLSGLGSLLIQPYTSNIAIGIAGGSGTWTLPASYFSSKFVNGFSGITIGSATAGAITVGSGSTLSYYDPLTLKTGGDISLAASAAVASSGSNSLTLWTTGGTINTAAGSTIATNGGNLTYKSTYAGTDKPLALAGGAAAGAGAINITANALTLTGSLSGSGSLLVEPYSSNTTIGIAGGSGTLSLPASYFSTNFSDGFSGITIGSATAGSINVGSLSYLDPLTFLTGGNIVFGSSAALTGSGNSLSLSSTGGAISLDASSSINTGAGSVTLTAAGNIDGAGPITADKLAVLGGSNVTLTNAGNTVGTLAASGVGSLSYVNSGALAIGTVGATNGIGATGAVGIATLTGNLTVSQNISTSATTSEALTLNAGRNAAAGTATGGDLVLSGNPTISVGSGGTATLYTGSVAGSTGLTARVGSGSGRFRYNSDESQTGYTTALGSGLYALYREQPTLTVTADDKAVTYGTAPVPTTTVTGAQNGDTLTTPATVTVGGTTSPSGNYTANTAHTLTPAGAASGLGYSIVYANGSLSVSPKALTISGLGSANKIYDGTTTATVSGTAALQAAEAVEIGSSADGKPYTSDNVALTGTAVGTFNSRNVEEATTVSFGGLSLSGTDAGNYTLTPHPTASQGITRKTVSLSASKVYDGTTGLSGAVTVTTGIGSETLNYGGAVASNSQVASSGKYVAAITLLDGGNGGLAGNYQLPTLNSANAPVEISPRPITVTAEGKSKVYGSADPALTYAYSGLASGDTASVISGALNRTAGENVAGGPYAIAQGSLSAGSNYSIVYTGANLVINPALLAVTAEGKSKVYGAADPALTYTYSGLVNGDTSSVFSGSLGRTVGENVAGGPYAINQGSLSAGSNYSIVFSAAGASLAITPAPLAVTAESKTKVYGAADPVLTYTYSGMASWDDASVFSGALSRVAGESIAGGPYAISQGSLSIGSNYNMTFAAAGASLAITPAPLAVKAEGKSKVYGSADPALTYTYSGMASWDNASVLSGALTRTAGESVAGGPYAIAQGTLSAGSNYSIVYTGANLVINPALLAVKAEGKGKIYGAADPALTYTYSGLANGDTAAVFSGLLSRAAGETVAGGPYAISQGALSAGSNYRIAYTGAELSIGPRPITLAATPVSKTVGDADPALSVSVAGGSLATAASGGPVNDTLSEVTGVLTRTPGDGVGTYDILLGQGAKAGNYSISFVSENKAVTIMPRIVLPNPVTTVGPSAVPSSSAAIAERANVVLVVEVVETKVAAVETSTPVAKTGSETAAPQKTAATDSTAAADSTAASTAAAETPTEASANKDESEEKSKSKKLAGKGREAATEQPADSAEAAPRETRVAASSAPAKGDTTPESPPAPPATTAAATKVAVTTAATTTASAPPVAPSAPAAGSAPAPAATATAKASTPAQPAMQPAKAGGEPSPSRVATSVAPENAAPAAPAAAPAPTVAAAVTQAPQILASAPAPLAAVSGIASAQVAAAIAGGMNPAQAEAAGGAFQRALTQQLSQGVPMAAAVARASAIFKAEAAFPAPASPQVAAAQSIATTAADSPATVSTRLAQLAGTKSEAGVRAFSQGLGAALSSGADMAAAVQKAKQGAQLQAMLAKADANLAQVLTGANLDIAALAGMPQQAQMLLGKLLAQGMPFGQAFQVAAAAQGVIRQGERADAVNPDSGVASGTLVALGEATKSESLRKALSSNMAGGLPLAQAVQRAQRADGEVQRLAKLDQGSAQAAWSNGAAALPGKGKDADLAIAAAIARGESPAQAAQMLEKIAKALPPEKPSAARALASGNAASDLLSSPGNSRVFAKALGNALDKGVPVDKALQMARRAENEAAVHLPLPKSLSEQIARHGAESVSVRTAQGEPLPAWLKFDPASKTFVAHDVPPGELPLQVVVGVGDRQTTVQISEQALQK